MTRYQTGDDPGQLEHWPFDNPASAYQILSGTPQTSGRFDAGGAGHLTRAGIWRCTQGRFSCIEQGDEMMTVLSGSGALIYPEAELTVPLAAGDTVFIADGSHVIWHIENTLTKVFFGFKADGY